MAPSLEISCDSSVQFFAVRFVLFTVNPPSHGQGMGQCVLARSRSSLEPYKTKKRVAGNEDAGDQDRNPLL